MLTDSKKATFGTKAVCKITNVSPRQLHYWTNIGLLKASASSTHRRHHKFRYNVRDILTVLVIKELRNYGLSLQRIRQSVDRVRSIWGKEQPLAQLRVACLAQSIVFKKGGAYLEALSGQQVIEAALQKVRNHIEPKRCGQTGRMVARQREIFLREVSEM